ncbi:MAG: hypothetical protein A2X82_01430 [Geobacteraceae bacterium GWC2_55_20]|nr:MAG: hypothetical protein A2X82_01430 [Geobacteraceae bacterium GWC2_55_20]OGU25857.1 MAG: hypothetical protein A2X85_16610 [Geobacteraceae bacterium GWF2_54_21]
MNLEFHYWITGIIAERAGFIDDEPQIIAYSSQYVDDNDFEILVFDDELDVVPSYISQVSQTMNILLPRKDIMRIYPLFHFIPGDQPQISNRQDGRSHPMNTTPDSSYANTLMQYTLKNAASRYKAGDKGGLYRLGVMTHAFVDTWAHQNFIGWFDDFNAIGSNIIPDIGHADALHHPDWVGHRWNDQRLKVYDVDNISRFLGAARKTYAYFADFRQQVTGKTLENNWAGLESDLKIIFGNSYSGDDEIGADARLAQYKCISKMLTGYDEHEWLSNATDQDRVFNGATDGYDQKYVWKDANSKANTDWHRFQEAVKDHVITATNVLRPVFAQAGIVL